MKAEKEGGDKSREIAWESTENIESICAFFPPPMHNSLLTDCGTVIS